MRSEYVSKKRMDRYREVSNGKWYVYKYLISSYVLILSILFFNTDISITPHICNISVFHFGSDIEYIDNFDTWGGPLGEYSNRSWKATGIHTSQPAGFFY